MRINPFVYGAIVLTVFFGIILGFQSAGVWSVSGKVTSSGERVQPSAADVETIKGWMSLDQIVTTYGVSLAELLGQFNLPVDTPVSTSISDLESDTFDTTLLKAWLQSRIDGLVNSQTSIITPVTTPQVLSTPEILAEASPSSTEHVPEDMTITGKTTFLQLLDWGLSIDVIQKIIGDELPPSSLIIKDYVTGKGMEFTTAKTMLQAELDRLK
jgi:hypothetical protein